MSQKLFKYCRINDYTKENLKNNQLYYNDAKRFNDPYEGLFDYDIKDDRVKKSLIKLLYQNNYQKLIDSGKDIDSLIDHTRREQVTGFLHGDVKVCCMSCINDSLLMWGHYADSHTRNMY